MRIRIALVAVVTVALVAACKGKQAPLPKLSEHAPVMADAARLLGVEVAAPPVLVLIGADGALAVADAPAGADAWTVLSTKPPRSKGQPLDLESIGPIIREAVALGQKIEPMLKDRKDDGVDLAAAPPDTLARDDPPPPEPEEEEDDDEHGGTGTAMALDEGKMGKKDSDRAEGMYTMKRSGGDLARQQAIDAARTAGIIGSLDQGQARGGFGFGAVEPDPELPSRAAHVVGRAGSPGDPRADALIVAAPTAKATALVDVLANLRGTFIAVAHQGTLRALRIGFGLDRPDFGTTMTGESWLEVRIGTDALALEAVPGPPVMVPWASGALDAAAVAKAYAEVRAALGDDQRLDIDVLVGPDTDVQRLVDVIAALDGAGALAVALGRTPAADSPEARKRGQRIVRARAGQPQSVGDLDKAIIRRYVKRALPQVKACYEKALATQPDLAGTVSTQFFIASNGVVASANAAGVDGEVAACVAAVIKGIEFPKPKGGGGVQVNYPFSFKH